MPIVHQEDGFTFKIEASFVGPPYVYVTKGKGFIIIRIGDPQTELPHIDRHKGVSKDDLDYADNIVRTYQEKYLSIWERNH